MSIDAANQHVVRTGETGQSADFDDGALFEKISVDGRTMWSRKDALDTQAVAHPIATVSSPSADHDQWGWLAVGILVVWVLS